MSRHDWHVVWKEDRRACFKQGCGNGWIWPGPGFESEPDPGKGPATKGKGPATKKTRIRIRTSKKKPETTLKKTGSDLQEKLFFRIQPARKHQIRIRPLIKHLDPYPYRSPGILRNWCAQILQNIFVGIQLPCLGRLKDRLSYQKNLYEYLV